MKINRETIDLIKEFEGLRLKAYYCPAGVLTIGYGYTNKAGYGPGVKPGDVWTEQQAEEMLIEGIDRFARKVHVLLKRNATPNQFGAMVSLAYNIGLGSFARSTCLRLFNEGDIKGSADALTWFNKANGKVLKGLVRRRGAEAALFLKEDGRPVKVDTAKEKPVKVNAIFALLALLSRIFGGKK